MPQKKAGLKDIRSNLLSRGLALARAGFQATGFATNNTSKIEFLVKELGQLKGTAMKVGQTLSMYGEHLLPKEVNDILKKLQQEAPPLQFERLKEVLIEELGAEKVEELEIDETPFAAASIGQVHRARVKSTGQSVALKIQYPGVADAVDTDLKLLKFILSMTELVPRGPRFDQVFAEIREMFNQEIDYNIEKHYTEKFAAILKDDERYIVPEVLSRYCTSKVLCMDFIEGVRLDSSEVQELSLERRNRLGLNYLDLYLRELTEFKFVQTDPHLGNYKVHVDPTGENDKLILLDFGAVRAVPEDFLTSYRILMEGTAFRDERKIEKGGRMLGLLKPDDKDELVKDYAEVCFLIGEPFSCGVYDWGASDLPQRVAKQAFKIGTTYRLRAPPRELVFLDRKLGGVFIFLSVLKCKMDSRELLLEALEPA